MVDLADPLVRGETRDRELEDVVVDQQAEPLLAADHLVQRAGREAGEDAVCGGGLLGGEG